MIRRIRMLTKPFTQRAASFVISYILYSLKYTTLILHISDNQKPITNVRHDHLELVPEADSEVLPDGAVDPKKYFGPALAIARHNSDGIGQADEDYTSMKNMLNTVYVQLFAWQFQQKLSPGLEAQ